MGADSEQPSAEPRRHMRPFSSPRPFFEFGIYNISFVLRCLQQKSVSFPFVHCELNFHANAP